MTFIEKEITNPVLLCNSDGKLNPDSVGWARRPIITSNVTGSFTRKKKWNYWCVYGQDAMFSATISHLDYAAVCFVYYLEYETNQFFEKTITIPFGINCHLPNEVQATAEAIHKDMSLFFISNEKETLLKITCPDFDGENLEVDIAITYPPDIDTLNVVVPWSEKRFQFTAKHHCLPTSGYFKVGEKTFRFDPATDFAVLDYGRGIWPYSSTWNWGMASGKQGEDTVGINLGGQWTDHTGSTENAVIVNNKLTKIGEDLQFHYDRDNYMKPWFVDCQSGRVELTFTPFFERIAATNVGIIQSEVHQMFGHYHGRIYLSGSESIEITNLLGSIEDHAARW